MRVFVTLVEAGGFAEAQIALNLSTSTLSTHLATLERKLGGELCKRGRAGFRLTSFGRSAYEAAKTLFDNIETFEARIGRDKGQLVGRLRLGIVDGIISHPKLALQATLDRFMADAAGVFIELRLGTPQQLEQAVSEGVHDLAIGPFSQKAPGIVYVPLHNEPHGLYCGAGHPLFTLPQNRIGEDEIGEAMFSVRGYRYLDDLYRANHPRASASVVQMEAQAMMILSGRFIGFLPCHIADPWVAQNRMRRLRPDAYSFASHHFAAVRRSDRDHSLIAKFLKEARRSARPGRREAAVGSVTGAPGETREGASGEAPAAMKEG
ncbi:MAG TPA: LysR family transcriptional regulator [Hyphomicrobiales bacterium]